MTRSMLAPACWIHGSCSTMSRSFVVGIQLMLSVQAVSLKAERSILFSVAGSSFWIQQQDDRSCKAEPRCQA